MITAYGEDSIWIFGQSSGGSLALCLCNAIRSMNLDIPFPHGLILSSPLLQYPVTEEEVERMKLLDRKDALIPYQLYADDSWMAMLAGKDPSCMSVLDIRKADLTGYPKTWIFMGDSETHCALLGGALACFQKAQVPVRVIIGEGMGHCWGAWAFTPEARKMRKTCFGIIRHFS